ncbi:MAG: bifunctional riboflavin kinase/FAD synthetase [Hydrogenophilus sp.]|nr:bifunctional riboflavin kinase/FAD synthetase [Hydrogenophilus sp.]
MKITRRYTLLSTPTVLTIGNLDGVHRGHQALLRLVVERARTQQLTAAVLTFEPHPRERLHPHDPPARLTPFRAKALAIAAEGIDHLHLLPFTRAIASWSPEAFIAYLTKTLNLRYLIVGDDFRFGVHRSGTLETLLEAGDRLGFTVEILPALTHGGERISSSAVRSALARGDMRQAAKLLGRWHTLCGRVIRGLGLGRSLAAPTLNLALPANLLLPRGVFTGWVTELTARPEPAVIAIGERPTLALSCSIPTVEAHLLTWSGDAYGRRVRLHLADRLRHERLFPSLAALADQIADDIAQARRWHSQHPVVETSLPGVVA